MVDRIYPTELQLNKANSSDKEAPFYAPNFEDVGGPYCFCSVRPSVRHAFCMHSIF